MVGCCLVVVARVSHPPPSELRSHPSLFVFLPWLLPVSRPSRATLGVRGGRLAVQHQELGQRDCQVSVGRVHEAHPCKRRGFHPPGWRSVEAERGKRLSVPTVLKKYRPLSAVLGFALTALWRGSAIGLFVFFYQTYPGLADRGLSGRHRAGSRGGGLPRQRARLLHGRSVYQRVYRTRFPPPPL